MDFAVGVGILKSISEIPVAKLREREKTKKKKRQPLAVDIPSCNWKMKFERNHTKIKDDNKLLCVDAFKTL